MNLSSIVIHLGIRPKAGSALQAILVYGQCQY